MSAPRETGTPAPLEGLRAAVARKSRESQETQGEFFHAEADRIVACASAMADAFARGGRLLAMGNGGSACDAQHMVVEFMHPIIEKRAALPAIALGSDVALLSAIGNDEDFSQVFAMQLRTIGRPGDIALAISTSGKSANAVRALSAAREMGMLTVAFTGRDGGRMADLCAFCFTVPSFSTHRIQEAHATLLHILWDLVHVVRGEEDVL
ncbi:phosphoheptose isomerase [Sorangium cellulosum]|uniref:Phosphoheptose isomerase n=1 Tax=Sorangium cellulosum TaxID=56 RepID=A0A2L0F5N8_SORCE|nr:SIS domain-containing protein [Sorangium cellulosum]AUX46837.1 phosphoheptose isomerase [Sorangium cellulosum]